MLLLLLLLLPLLSLLAGLQGGPHNHTISGLACALKQAQSAEFKQYQQQVLANSKALADGLQKRGFTLVSGEGLHQGRTIPKIAVLSVLHSSVKASHCSSASVVLALVLSSNSISGDVC